MPDSVYLNKNDYMPNPYDKGIFANLSTFLGHDPWFWWYPTVKDLTDEGTHHEPLPIVNKYSLAFRSIQEGKNPPELATFMKQKPKSIDDVDVEKILEEAEKHVEKRNILNGGILHVYGRRADNSCQ